MPRIPTNTPTIINTHAPETIVVTLNNGTRLRTGPGLIYDITQVLDSGQELTVIAKHDGADDGQAWLLIETDALKAWIAERTIDWVSGSLNGLSASDNIPSTPTALPPTNTVLPPTNTVIPPTAIPPDVAPPTNTPLPPATDIPLPTQQPEVCYCGGNTLNCGNFGYQSSAQACFNYCLSQGSGDIHRLDGDKDGYACESLP
tara:strand:+ start:432 stop:1037 length:606 start_codon:yes stop_codon:yes gene_type:complete